MCNHANYFGCTFLVLLVMPRKAIFISLERLFCVHVVSQLIYFLRSVPVSSSPSRIRSFFLQMVQMAETVVCCVSIPRGN